MLICLFLLIKITVRLCPLNWPIIHIDNTSMSDHNPHKFLQEAGMAPDEIARIMAQDLGLRQRRREKQTKAPPIVQAPQKQRPPRVAKTEVIKKELPASEEEFKESYLNHRTAGTQQDKEWRQHHIPLLYKLIKNAHQAKGIVQVLSVGGWKALVQQLREADKELEKYDFDQLLAIYVKHLIQYEFSLKGEELTIKEGVELGKSLSEALFIKGQLAQIIRRPTQGLEILKEEVVIFPKGVEELGIKYEDINLAKIEAECGEQLIDIRVQHPMDYGFNINKMTNECAKMSIAQYCQYQRNYKVQAFKKDKYGEQLKNGKIFFGVNFQPSRLDIFSSLWEKLQSNFLGFAQNFDLLSYLDTEIPGCSSPQFYLKVKGCWTGGHQQNLAMCAVNINHGPDPSQWFTIPYSQVERVRKALHQKFKLELYKDQGLWYQKINWFIQNGYPIKRILQQQGDIVVSGPGTLHWVRSFGIALQSAWNIFPKNYNMIQCAMHRFQQNLAIKLEKTSVIPFKGLLVKYLQHEYMTINEKVLEIVLVNIEQWMNNQHRLRLELTDSCNLGLQSAIQEKISDLQSFCQVCKQQVFTFFVSSWTGKGIACLQCLADNPVLHNKQSIRLYFKYSYFHMKNLLDAAKNRKRTDKRTIGYPFCDGVHIGKVECPIKEIGSRKRERQPIPDHVTTESGNEDSNPNEQIMEKVLIYYESLSQENKKTFAEIVQAKKLKLIENVKSKTIETQTDDITCTTCFTDLNFEKMNKPTKRFRSNKDYEQRMSSSNREEEIDKPLKDYQPQRREHNNHRNNYRENNERRRDQEEKRRGESREEHSKQASKHERRNEQPQKNDHQHRRQSNRNNDQGYRNNRDSKYNRDRDNRENGQNRDNRDNRGRQQQNSNYRGNNERKFNKDSSSNNNRDRAPTNDRSNYKHEDSKNAPKASEQENIIDY